MNVVVDGVESAIVVEEADELSILSVEIRDCSVGDAALLLYGLGWLDGSHAWLNIEALRAASPYLGRGNWDDHFDAMVVNAGTSGWADTTREHVRASVAVAPAPVCVDGGLGGRAAI